MTIFRRHSMRGKITGWRSGMRCYGVQAQRAGVRHLLTDDPQDGFELAGVRFVNPFEAANNRLIDEVLPAQLPSRLPVQLRSIPTNCSAGGSNFVADSGPRSSQF